MLGPTASEYFYAMVMVVLFGNVYDIVIGTDHANKLLWSRTITKYLKEENKNINLVFALKIIYQKKKL